jgi:hypothetical protein
MHGFGSGFGSGLGSSLLIILLSKKQLNGFLQCFKVAFLTGVKNRGGAICL